MVCSNLLLILACIYPAPSAALAAADLPVTVSIHARELAPGEPVRVEVLSAEPLDSLEGTFLGESLFMSRIGASEEGERWFGWSMIALDQEPGPAAVELSGRSLDGRVVVGTHELTIAAKGFPEEHLTVSNKYVEPPKEVQERLARERKKLRAIYKARKPLERVGDPFIRPVPGEPTSTFGKRRFFNGQPRAPHPGLDLRAAVGTPVVASGGGEVVIAQDLYYSGNVVIIDHGGGLFTIYAHLSEIGVEEGEIVESGALLGLSGATGRVTGPHLHWGAKIGNRPFDPTALLDEKLFRR
jgi:murein DD-endopeptidase MepM/ murein hydrolase activator NlpD